MSDAATQLHEADHLLRTRPLREWTRFGDPVPPRLRLLGPLEIGSRDRPVTFHSRTQRAVLGFLLLHPNEPIAEHRLRAAVWQGHEPPTARKMLKNTVSALRTLPLLDSGWALASHRSGLQLSIDAAQIDSSVFTEATLRGRALLDAGEWHSARDVLRDADRLWRGEVLADVPGSANWPETKALGELRALTLRAWMSAELLLDHPHAVVTELVPLLPDHVGDVILCAQAMLALYRSGRQADALTTFRHTSTAIAFRNGTIPAWLSELARGMLAQDRLLDERSPVVPGVRAALTGRV